MSKEIRKEPKEVEEKRIKDSVRFFIENSELNQKQISDITGIQPGLVSEYKSGDKIPSMRSAIRLADCFDVTIDELVGHTTNYSSTFKNLQELLSAIYAINEVLPLTYKDGTLSFNNAVMNEYLSAWEWIKSSPLSQEDTNRMLEDWKKGSSEDASKIVISYGYRSAEEWAEELIEDFNTHHREIFHSVISVEGYPNEVLDIVKRELDITILNEQIEEPEA